MVFIFTKPMVTLLARTKFFGQGHKWSGLDREHLGHAAARRQAQADTAARRRGGLMSKLGQLGAALYSG